MSHLSFDPGEPSRERGDAGPAEDHIDGERLAALADEQPTTAETAHLAQCAECAREVEAHRSLFSMAGSERESMGLPLTRWESLAPALRADGLIGHRDRGGSGREPKVFNPHRLLQVAAALLLVASGGLLGRMSAGSPLLPGAEPASPVASLDSLPTNFASIEEAMRLRNLYRDGYQRAVSYLAQSDSARTGETPASMRARLAVLDRVSRITSEALNDAPFDPVLNDFLLNAFGQREATLRELNTVLPVGVRLNSY